MDETAMRFRGLGREKRLIIVYYECRQGTARTSSRTHFPAPLGPKGVAAHPLESRRWNLRIPRTLKESATSLYSSRFLEGFRLPWPFDWQLYEAPGATAVFHPGKEAALFGIVPQMVWSVFGVKTH